MYLFCEKMNFAAKIRLEKALEEVEKEAFRPNCAATLI